MFAYMDYYIYVLHFLWDQIFRYRYLVWQCFSLGLNDIVTWWLEKDEWGLFWPYIQLNRNFMISIKMFLCEHDMVCMSFKVHMRFHLIAKLYTIHPDLIVMCKILSKDDLQHPKACLWDRDMGGLWIIVQVYIIAMLYKMLYWWVSARKT